MNRTGFPESVWFKLCGHGRLVECGVEVGFGFSRWDVADGFKQAPVIEPVDPFEGGKLNGFDGPPRPASVDHLGLVESLMLSAKALS